MTKNKLVLYTFTIGAFLCMSCKQEPTDNTPWVTLFDGQSLEGWTQKEGTANYKVRDNSIVGGTVHNTPNSFLTSNKMYGDFILELDYKVDPSMNSGIQIRSNSIPHYMDGRVHGYQIEIDPFNRALGVDLPNSVTSFGGKYTYDDDWEFVENQQVTFSFDNDKFITWTGHSRGIMKRKDREGALPSTAAKAPSC